MINPNGSNIPLARKLLRGILHRRNLVDDQDRLDIIAALDVMERQQPVRVANTQQRVKITAQMKAQIKALAPDLSLTNSDIAKQVGLPPCASGRVTEVLQGLR